MSAAKTSKRITKAPSDAAGYAVTGADKAAIQEMFDRQVCEALWAPSDLSREEILERMATAVAAVRSLEPRGIVEEMLAVQIVATHNAALDCLRRAALPGQSPHVWEMSLRQGDKLMATCQRHMEAFARLRGKDTAGVMLGNILNVQPGGQAVVRMQAVLPAEQSDAHAGPSILALEHQPVEPLEFGRSSTPAVSVAPIKGSPPPPHEGKRIKRSAEASEERVGRRG